MSNGVLPVAKPGYMPASDRALVIIGVGVEGKRRSELFSIRLHEYDMVKHSATGDCMRWNRIETHVPSASTEIQYFVFDVASGFYAGDDVGGPIGYRRSALAFEVPAGQAVYLGNLIYAKNGTVDLRHDLDAAKANLRSSFPKVVTEPIIAKTVPVPPLRGILCTP